MIDYQSLTSIILMSLFLLSVCVCVCVCDTRFFDLIYTRPEGNARRGAANISITVNVRQYKYLGW